MAGAHLGGPPPVLTPGEISVETQRVEGDEETCMWEGGGTKKRGGGGRKETPAKSITQSSEGRRSLGPIGQNSTHTPPMVSLVSGGSVRGIFNTPTEQGRKCDADILVDHNDLNPQAFD